LCNKITLLLKLTNIFMLVMKSKVTIVRCETYDTRVVKNAVEKGIAMLGGIRQFFTKGEKILLKVNLLVGDPPEKCVTTHPSVFRAVAELFKEAGAVVTYGDSPSFGTPAAAARRSGLLSVADELDIDMANFTDGIEVFHEKGMQNKKFLIAQGVHDADGIVSLPKLKTHGLERITGCIKNQFGCVVGIRKGEFHVKLPDAKEFAKMLVDLNNYVKPRLYIMDGIMAMEGNGPRGGDPRPMNVLLFSADPVALDSTVCRMIDLNPDFVPVLKYGSESGAGTFNTSEIEFEGDEPGSFFTPDFKVDRSPIRSYKSNPLHSFLNNRLIPKPVILKDRCTKCGTCVNNCPVSEKAVNWKNGNKFIPPVYDYSKCIRCYCCQEVCPEKAIIIRYPVIQQLLSRVIS
jgi:uncharacterized protein (DUF362 family)/Pyruvate/2-oxoacid:ferredoxin oxidoreductase delta subunit